MSNPTELPDLDKLEALADEDIEEIAVDYYRAMTDSIDDVIGFGRAVERAVLARRARPEGEAPHWGPVRTVGDLVRNLTTLEQDASIVTAFHIDFEGKRRCRAQQGITISRERVVDGRWIDSARKDVPHAYVLWAKPDESESGAPAALEQAAALVAKMTAPPRDLMGAPTVAMKTTANLGQRIATAIRALTPDLAAQSQGAQAHADDLAVDRFAAAMKAKMAASRAKGRSGWDDLSRCPTERLQAMLAGHMHKGDPTDVGNFAMMLWSRNEPTAAQQAAAPGALPDQAQFEAQARYQGATNFEPVHPDFMACNNGWTPATYRDPMTELAWRVWANKRAAPSAPGTPEAPKGGA